MYTIETLLTQLKQRERQKNQLIYIMQLDYIYL
jgi:hypothetical protein